MTSPRPSRCEDDGDLVAFGPCDRSAVVVPYRAIVYMADAVGTQTETLAVRGLSVGVPIRRFAAKEMDVGALIGCVGSALFFPFGARNRHRRMSANSSPHPTEPAPTR